MIRRSAHMLRVGMKILIDGHEQYITKVNVDTEAERVIITCGENVYRRTPGAKIIVTRTAK